MSIKTKSAKYAKMQRGEYQSTICPYGYRKSADGRMEPDPEAAAVVLLIFQLAADGKNAPSIARELYKRGIPTPAEYKIARGQKTHDVSRTHGIWCDSTIVRYLADERYTGTYIIGKRAVLEVGGNNSRFKDRSKWYIIPDHHPAIVDKALFDKVQETVRRFSQPQKKQRDYLLKGIVFCGCCDHALSYVSNKRPYFVCRRSQAAENGPCHDLKVNAEELEQVIWGTIKAQLEAVLSIRMDGSICLDTVVAERTEYEKQIEALEDSNTNKHVLLISYTNEGVRSLENEYRKQNGGVLDDRVIFKSWYSTLLSEFIKPYQCSLKLRQYRTEKKCHIPPSVI